MKHNIILILTLLLSIISYAQDTLQKVIEYDISLESVSQIDDLIFQKHIACAGDQNWLEVLIEKASTAKLFLFQRDLYHCWYRLPENPPVENIARIDTTTYEEFFDTVILDSWTYTNITAIRFHKRLMWDSSLNSWHIEFTAFAPVYKTHTTDGKFWDNRVYFWIPLMEMYNKW